MKGPGIMLLGTPWQRDPTKCPHQIKQFIGTEFRPGFGREKHQINQLFRCPDCGKTERVARTAREAGKYGSIEIEDPRVKDTIVPTDEAMDYIYPEFKERFGGKKPGMEIFQVPDYLRGEK